MVEATIASRQTIDVLPVNTGGNKFRDAYLEFNIKGVNGHFLDMSSLALELSLAVTGEDGASAIGDAENVTISNGLSQTLFKSIVVYFNETVVETNSLFSYWSYIKLLTTISGCEAERYRKLAHFFKGNDPSRFSNDYFAAMTEEREQQMTEMKTMGVHTCFKLLADVTTISEYVLDNVDVRIRLELNPDKWIIHSERDNANFKYHIKMARLWIDRIMPYPAGLTAINKALIQNNTPITYTFNKTLLKTHILGTGQRTITMDQPWGTVVPERLYMIIVDMEAMSGGYTQNPLYFENCQLTSVFITLNSTTLFNIACAFPHNCAKLYYTTLQALGFDNAHTLSYDAFVNGGTILAFNLQPETIKDAMPLEVSGNLRISLEFKMPVVGNKVILLYGGTTGILKINAERRIVCDTRA
ncbi:uncharacterized protein [Procambarus clarkii]|uniref:uncharacterized protein n=1 Tax=Procambarus clarkii TaxID=6728 RepID=UPI003741ECC6